MKTWTEDETRVLMDHYNCVDNNTLCELLPNKTAKAIYKKAYKMGMRKSAEITFLNRSNANSAAKSSNWKGGVCTTQKGYKLVKLPNHHRANKRGYVCEHIVVWEQSNGMTIPDGCIVHHINEIKSDNRPENLMLMTAQEHSTYHNKKRSCSEKTRSILSEKAKQRLVVPQVHPRYKNIDVLQMQQEIKAGATVASVCEKYNINKTTYYKKLKREGA